MPLIHEMAIDNPVWAERAEIEDHKWQHYCPTLKAMWRKYHTSKKDDNEERYRSMLGVGETVYKYYLRDQFIPYIDCIISYISYRDQFIVLLVYFKGFCCQFL